MIEVSEIDIDCDETGKISGGSVLLSGLSADDLKHFAWFASGDERVLTVSRERVRP